MFLRLGYKFLSNFSKNMNKILFISQQIRFKYLLVMTLKDSINMTWQIVLKNVQVKNNNFIQKQNNDDFLTLKFEIFFFFLYGRRPGKFQHYHKFSSKLCSQGNNEKDLMVLVILIMHTYKDSKRLNNG